MRAKKGRAAAEALFKANKCILQRALENETQRMMPTFGRLILHLNLNVALKKTMIHVFFHLTLTQCCDLENKLGELASWVS